MGEGLTAIYHFVQGIPGFGEYHHFRLEQDDEAPLAHLISVEDERIGFILLRPETFFPDYAPVMEINDEEATALGVAADQPVEKWVIVTLNQKDMTKTTVNLRAPILLNEQTKQGVQVILKDERFSIKQPLLTQAKVEIQEGNAG